MNAYELADWMEWWTENKPYPEENQKIIDMLRQQADRIAGLEKQLEEANSVLDTIDCGDSIK